MGRFHGAGKKHILGTKTLTMSNFKALLQSSSITEVHGLGNTPGVLFGERVAKIATAAATADCTTVTGVTATLGVELLGLQRHCSQNTFI